MRSVTFARNFDWRLAPDRVAVYRAGESYSVSEKVEAAARKAKALAPEPKPEPPAEA